MSIVSRRRFLALSFAATCTIAARARAQEITATGQYRAALPLVVAPIPSPTASPTASPTPTTPAPGDAPILGYATGSVDQAVAWLSPRADASYTDFDIRSIVEAYQRVGDSVGVDWFSVIAQMAHETGHITSFWSFRPQRNPAGIGVTGESRPDQPPDTTGWAYNTQRGRWERGISFPTWADHSIPAHIGRLLAYALTDEQASQAQRDMIAFALSYRGISAANRGVAPTWTGLNGRWAVPGTTYGQSILALAAKMRA
jgi:hypothetical protein